MFKKITKIPTHVAFIMDGNRRWAKRHGLPKHLGHRKGAESLKKLIKTLLDYQGIKYASFFLFSTENWKREKSEIDYIFSLAHEFLLENEKSCVEKGIKIVCLGDLNALPQDLKDLLEKIVDETKMNDKIVINLAINYGGRAEIVRALKKIVNNGEEISIENINKNLYSYPAPDVDLLVRTSGEMRLSNFMLFQLAYSELYFTKKCWPEFDEKELKKALVVYSKRNRRFGGK